MARDRTANVVRAACLRHRAHRLRSTDAVGDVGIPRRLADRNRPQRLPNALLERGATHVQGKDRKTVGVAGDH
jgi:hypothetical protein